MRPFARLLALLFALPLLAATPAPAAKPAETAKYDGLKLRNIGPAMPSGRIIDIAVDPRDERTWYVAVASGGVWKTTNAGTTFTPVFDDEGSYSIGCVTIDPNNSLVVWVGSGENNSQRSVSYGDGVYKSVDGGKTWKNVGLKQSEHIGKIVVDPRDSNVVYVAAQGPLWNAGGDRGLYKTTDGGKTWKPALKISENTGITDVVYDPGNPDILYAAAYQRRRHVYTLINGGPESGIHKSTDGGATWTKLESGLPKEWMGRIGLAIPKNEPNTVYAIIEATRRAGGFFRLAGRRGELREDEFLLRRRRAVLRRDLRRSEQRRPRLLHGRLGEGLGRRRQDVAQDRRDHQASGQPRHVDRPGEQRPLSDRLRRRSVRDLRRRGDVGVQGEPAGHAVLPHQRGRRSPLLPRVRRHAGQLLPRRSAPHADLARACATRTGT